MPVTQSSTEALVVDERVSMVHLTDFPYEVALCGTPMRGAFADGEPAECVVCAELNAAEGWAP